MNESLTELIEELGNKIISLNESPGSPTEITVNGNLISPKELNSLRKAFNESKQPYDLTMKGSAYEKGKS